VHGTRVLLQMQLRTASMTYDDDAHAASAKIIWMLLRTHLSLMRCCSSAHATTNQQGTSMVAHCCVHVCFVSMVVECAM
jgi:hypothetical protein